MGAETEVVPQNKHAPVPPVQQERPVQGSIPISDVRLPKSDALVLKADMPTLEQAIGKEKSQQYHQRITEVARQVDLVKDHSHFLTTANVDSYSKILSTSIIEISKALEKQDPEALEKALSKLESKLKILDKFITYEKTQGLVGTHAESGVRIYVKGDKVYLCTPDPKAFSDVLKNPEVKENLEKFVQAVTGGGIKSIDFAKFQNSEERDGVKLLSCRVDNINKEEGKSEFKLKTKVRAKNGEFEWKEISFTLKDLVGGALRNVEGFNGPGKIPEAHINTGNGSTVTSAELALPPRSQWARPAIEAAVRNPRGAVSEIRGSAERAIKTTRRAFTRTAPVTKTPAPETATGTAEALPSSEVTAETRSYRAGRWVRDTFRNARNYFRGSGEATPTTEPTTGAGEVVSATEATTESRSFRAGRWVRDTYMRAKSFFSRPAPVAEVAPVSTSNIIIPGEAVAPINPPKLVIPGEAVAPINPPKLVIPGEAVAPINVPELIIPGEAVAPINPPKLVIPGESVAPTNAPSLIIPGEIPVAPAQNIVIPSESSVPISSSTTVEATPSAVGEANPVAESWAARNLPTGSRVVTGIRSLGSRPEVQNAGLISALVIAHNAGTGGYKENAQHSYIPSLLRSQVMGGSLADDNFEKLFFTTEQGGYVFGIPINAVTSDASSAVGDIGIIYYGAQGMKWSVGNKASQWLLTRTIGGTGARFAAGTAAVPSTLVKGLGRFAAVAYVPYSGYTSFSDGQFIHESKTDLNIRFGTVMGEGIVIGFMVGGPWGAAAGAAGSGISATAGSFSALSDVLEEGQLSAKEHGVKRTIENALERGWIKGENQQRNIVTPEARDYIERMAKVDFMQRMIRMKQDGRVTGSEKIPFYSDNWDENWRNIDALLKEIRDCKDDANAYYFSDPLDDYSPEVRTQMLEVYDFVFGNEDGTKTQLTRAYENAILVETNLGWKRLGQTEWDEKNPQTSFEAFRGVNISNKSMERNEISQIAREYKNAGFAGRQKELEDQKVKFQDSKVQGLMKEQREFILSRMPNFFESMANEESRSVFEHYSTNGDDNGRVTTEGRGHSEILNSFAFQHQQQRVNDAKKQLEIFQSPEFQLDILATLPSNDSGSRELLQKLFRQEQLTEGEHLKLNPILESAVKRFYRSEKK